MRKSWRQAERAAEGGRFYLKASASPSREAPNRNLAEEVGSNPRMVAHCRFFKTGAFNRSATLPRTGSPLRRRFSIAERTRRRGRFATLIRVD